MEILWSPTNDNEFILYGTNIFLYRIASLDNTINRNRIDSNLFLNESSYAKLIGSNNSYPNPKIVAWYPGLELGIHTLAMHEQNQIQLKLLGLPIANLDQSNQTNNEISFLDMEIPRKINQLKWNQVKSNYLGIGCEKSMDKSTIMIWDPFVLSTKAQYELNEFNSCESYCWHPGISDLLFVTSSNNQLSLYDLRNGLNPIESVNTKYIKGFEIDSKNPYRAISYDQNKLAVWDLRKFNGDKSLLAEIEEPKSIRKVNFCPAKSDRYAILHENSTHVNVYRFEETDENLTRETINYKHHKNTSSINTFCWHSKDYNRLLISLTPYNNLADLVVSDYCPIDFSINENLNVCINDKVLVSNQSRMDNKDIGEKMKMRALRSYGVNDNFLFNLELISNDDYESDLRYLWQWFELSNKIYDKTVPTLEKYIGIKTIVSKIGHNSNESSVNAQYLNVYKNFILKMCGWNNLKELISQLEERKEYERAACICVFNKNLEKAIELLTTASKSSNLNEYLALSLALNFILNNPNDYKDSNRILSKLTNPYLKALFSYQIDQETFDSQIYCDQNILIPDRIGMALTIFYYKIDQLTLFINKLANDCIKQGNLYGILLTGLNSDSIELFQTYINITSDVQTAAVAIIHSNCLKTISNKYVNAWIESYRELLDKWMLWEQRAKYDICRQELQKKSEHRGSEPRIHIRCGYCAENISTRRKLRNPHESTVGANIGMTCQACQKPSLRCSVCNLYMTVDPPKSAITCEKDKMAYWFVFCQKCTHGGHLDHLVKWFKTNPECPVMNCQCLCYIPEGILDE